MLNYYDLYWQGEFLGKFTAREAAQMVGCSEKTLREAARHYKTLKKEYRVENGIPEDFEKTWTEACNRIKKIAGLPVREKSRGKYILLHDGVRVDGILTAKQIGEICGCPPGNVGTYASHDYLYKKHWKIIRKDDYEAFKEMQKERKK